MTDVIEETTEEKEIFRNFYKVDNGGYECEVYMESTDSWILYHAVVGDDAPVAKAIFAHVRKNKIKRSSLEVSPSIAVRDNALERLWRDEELSRADSTINKIEDFEIEGDSKAWRQYRVALRNWPEHEKFPSKDSRPSAPDVK